MAMLSWIYRHCGLFSLRHNHKRQGHLIIIGLLLPSFYYAYYYNVWEYAMATPFAYFQYPLEVDLDTVVQRVINNQHPGVEPINRLNYPYIINCDKKCKDEDGNDANVYILFLIKSKMQHFEQRQMIRRTWGREHGVAYVHIRRVFLLGVDPEDKALQHRIGLEAKDYEDIVQQYFVDAYFNNTIKLMMGFQWAVQHCQGAKFLAFMDDDYYLNTYNLINLLQSVKPTDYNNLLIGYIWKNAMPYRIKDSKWYISLDEYPYRFWPPYPTAGSFFVPMETAEKLYIAMQYSKIIRFDDVFVGIVAWKLRVKLQGNNNLYFFKYEYDKEKYRKVIATHGYQDVEELYDVWKEQMELHKRWVYQ